MEKWFVINKGADFEKLGKEFGISPVTARLIRNREVIGEAAFEKYLHGTLKDLYNPHLLKDVEILTEILKTKIEEQKPVRIIGDYDIDGVMSTYILYQGIRHCGGNVSTQIPDRMKDGYGINENLIDQAKRDGMDTILTCDNGIAAISEIAHAKELGMTVLVTDHHEIPYTEENGEKQFLRSNADAIVNPKQQECAYPFKELCGAAVAWKVLQVLYEKMGFALEETYEFLENVAFATVGDVMDLTDENRILVKEGLNRIHRTKNPGMRALIFQNHLEPEQINAYHFGFVLGPCINASGRLDTAKLSLSLFLQGEEEAAKTARELVELNQQRKDMTADGVEEAKRVVEEHYMSDKVLVIYLPQVHESLAGIIAGRIREAYHKPVFVLTDAIEALLKPFAKLHLPVHELAMMMTIALRFIPLLIDETEKIMNAQKARGAMLDNGKFMDRIKALVPVLIPLFISAFRRADELAMAMECRCYHGGEGRTRLKVLKFGALDVKCAVVLTLCLAVILSTRWLMAGI